MGSSVSALCQAIVSKGMGFLVTPYGAAFIGTGRTEAAKNRMCYLGP